VFGVRLAPMDSLSGRTAAIDLIALAGGFIDMQSGDRASVLSRETEPSIRL
jgi:hypothetical protein